MFQYFAFVIFLNSFHIVEVKPIYSIDESNKNELITTTTTLPIIMEKIKPNSWHVTSNSKKCKFIIFPQLNWRTPFSLAKSGHKFRRIRYCKAKTTEAESTTTTVAVTTTVAATTTTTTVATLTVPSTPTSEAKTNNNQHSMNVLLRQV